MSISGIHPARSDLAGQISKIDYPYPKCFNLLMTPNKRSLNQADVDFLVKEMKHHFVSKEELKEALSHLPDNDKFTTTMSEILAAVNKKDENDAAHKMLHENIGDDVPKLQQQVKHIFKTFEIIDPTEVVPSY